MFKIKSNINPSFDLIFDILQLNVWHHVQGSTRCLILSWSLHFPSDIKSKHLNLMFSIKLKLALDISHQASTWCLTSSWSFNLISDIMLKVQLDDQNHVEACNWCPISSLSFKMISYIKSKLQHDVSHQVQSSFGYFKVRYLETNIKILCQGTCFDGA